jgi:hypothetical protein
MAGKTNVDVERQGLMVNEIEEQSPDSPPLAAATSSLRRTSLFALGAVTACILVVLASRVVGQEPAPPTSEEDHIIKLNAEEEEEPAPMMLNVVYSGDKGSFMIGFTAELSIPGSGAGPQQMLIDTGSSAVAFCDKSLAKGLKPVTYPHGIASDVNKSCIGGREVNGNAYGDSKHSNPEFYYGYNYVGDLLFDSDGVAERRFKDVSFGVMEVQQGMTCNHGFHGFWGVDFSWGGDSTQIQMNTNSNAEGVLCLPSLIKPWSKHQCAKLLNDGSAQLKKDWCVTSKPSYLNTVVGTALMEAGRQVFGLNLGVDRNNWKTLVADKEGGMMKNLGKAYIGSAAVTNCNYNANKPQVLPNGWGRGKRGLANQSWQLAVRQINVKANGYMKTFKQGEDLFCFQSEDLANCFLDSGTPSINLPDCIYEAAKEAPAGGEIEIIAGYDGDDTPLTFPIDTLTDMLDAGLAQTAGPCKPGKMEIVLGFPTWLFYYIVFDYGEAGPIVGEQKNTKMTFVAK